MQHQKVRFKIFAIALLPTILLSLILSAFFITNRYNELDQVFLDQNFNLIESLTPITQTHLAYNQHTALQSQVTRILEKPNVKSVLIYDQNKRLLMQAGPTPSLKHPNITDRLSRSKNISQTSSTILFTQPTKSAPWLTDINNSSIAPTANLGWIEIESYTLHNSLEKYKLLSITSICVLLIWLIHTLIAFRASNRASDSIQNLYHAIVAIKEGKLNIRVKFQGIQELKKLELEFNAMSRSIRSARHDLQLDVEQASENVRETLETIEIQNIELDMARKEALEASRIKSEFLANMSHEIRTPLNGIIGFTKLLLKSQLTPRQQDHVDTIYKSSDGLLAIINDILDFSKIEAGKLELDHTPLNLREVVEEVLTMLSPLAQEKKLEEVAIIYSDVPVHLIGDPLRLKQIITNLVNNAIKFTEHGSIIVRVMLEDQRNQQAYIRVSVSDSGIGLSTEEQKELFQAFNQGKSSNTQHAGGSGLGLVISKHLTEQMGGEIGLESSLGEGSNFWFTFKADIDSENDDLLDPTLFEQNRVAIFDSNDLVRLSLSHILQKAQIEHQQFSVPTELTQELATARDLGKPYSSVLIGINHTHENCSDLLDMLQYFEKTLDCRTIILANTSDQSHYHSLLEQSASAYLTKPIQLKRLLITLSNFQLSNQKSNLNDAETNLYKTPPQESSQQLNILAVDDNPTNLKLVHALLEEMNINIVSCSSGKEALSLQQRFTFDLILMDVRMPEMDGIETTRQIRKNEPQEKRIPIIAVTAHALANEKRKLLAQGMDDYITKPINDKLLRHIINKWVPITKQKALDQVDQSTVTEFDRPFPSPAHSQALDIHVTPQSASEQTDADLKAIDLERGIQLTGGKKDLAIELLGMLFNTLAADKNAIIESSQDHERLLDKVHHLHGATRYCGVPELQFHTHKVETLLKQDQPEQVEPALQALLSAIDRALASWQLSGPLLTGNQEGNVKESNKRANTSLTELAIDHSDA